MKVTKTLSILTLLCCSVIALLLYCNMLLEPKSYNLDEKIQFLQMSKGIETKDFTLILEDIQRAMTMQDMPTTPTESLQSNTELKDKAVSNQPLQLQAILNKNAYINNTWYHLGDTLYHDSKALKIQKILQNKVILIDLHNSNIIELEIFPKPNNLLFEIIDE